MFAGVVLIPVLARAVRMRIVPLGEVRMIIVVVGDIQRTITEEGDIQIALQVVRVVPLAYWDLGVEGPLLN